jgi:uncharacterized membrane protein
MPIGLTPVDLILVLVIALVVMAPIVVVVALLRRSGNGLGSDPLRIPDERLARVEITRDGYLETRRAMGR